jgi:Spx/MgsR family transcriptional regulator
MTKVVRKSTNSASRAKRKPYKTVQFLHNAKCATCRKARRFMEKRGYHLNFRDLIKNKLSSSELQKLIGKHDHEEFLNPQSEVYRENKMKEHPPNRREAISMMTRHPELIRRPVVVAGGRVVIGYDEKGMIRF